MFLDGKWLDVQKVGLFRAVFGIFDLEFPAIIHRLHDGGEVFLPGRHIFDGNPSREPFLAHREQVSDGEGVYQPSDAVVFVQGAFEVGNMIAVGAPVAFDHDSEDFLRRQAVVVECPS